MGVPLGNPLFTDEGRYQKKVTQDQGAEGNFGAGADRMAPRPRKAWHAS